MQVNVMAKQEKLKIFNDSVHGHIEMHPLLVKIIDTPEFQRLRNIKQLGGGYFVFPGASHNRFEHSIGVAHLAGQLVKSLKDRQGLDITDEDVLCVQIAGLCHDLGHGPFSHTFEEFMKKRYPEMKWKHEEQSIRMFKQLISDVEVEGHIKAIMKKDHELEQNEQNHIDFIKKLIHSSSAEKTEAPQASSQDDMEKPFLYEIVANKRTGIDVDKMDYFIRDCHHLGMKSNFSHERYMMFARVCTENGQQQICIRDKEAINMYELFHTRNILHQTAYQHRVTKAVELMIVDALIAADEGGFKIQMKGQGVTIREAVEKPEHFVNLTDDILQQIQHSAYPDYKLAANSNYKPEKLAEAKSIIDRITRRKLYKFIGCNLFEPKKMDGNWKTEVERLVKELNNGAKLPNNKEPFEAKFVKFNYGMKDKDPVESLRFYRKNDLNTAIQLSKEEVSNMRPKKFAETKVMLFYKPDDQRFEKLTKNIDLFWKSMPEPLPESAPVLEGQ